MPGRALIVEDTRSLAEIYGAWIGAESFQTQYAYTAAEAAAQVGAGTPDVILLDLKLPDGNGLDLLRQWKKEGVSSAIIVITGEASLNAAIESMRMGADDFVAKPVDRERLKVSILNAVEKRRLRRIVDTLPVEKTSFMGFIGKSPEMQAVYRMIESAAASSAPVMITGESGTGKEVAAQAIHSLGARKSKPIIALNCAAIPADLIESEIFGHVKGSFTGATTDRDGAARLADGGTLFLDELTEMPIELQSKLLRFIQTGVFTPVGGTKSFQTDIRFICATNRNPLHAVRDKRLREDLYYRLAVIPINIPSLRERHGDIELLADHFLAKASRQENKEFREIDAEARQTLAAHTWPGNVRELENTIRHAVIMNRGPVLSAPMINLPRAGADVPAASSPIGLLGANAAAPNFTLEQYERMAIEYVLAKCGGNITETARQLAVNPATIHRKLKQWATQK